MLTVVSSAVMVVSTMFGSGFVSITVGMSYGLPPEVACTAGGHALTGNARIEAMIAVTMRCDGRRLPRMYPPVARGLRRRPSHRQAVSLDRDNLSVCLVVVNYG